MGALSGRGGRLLGDVLLQLCIGRRTKSDRAANGIRSGGERNLIGQRMESDRAADGIRLDGGWNPIGRRTQTVSKVEKS